MGREASELAFPRGSVGTMRDDACVGTMQFSFIGYFEQKWDSPAEVFVAQTAQ